MLTDPRPLLQRLFSNTYVFWLLLALPAVYIVADGKLSAGRPHYLRDTGLVSCWFFIVTLMITPLAMLVGATPWMRWLKAQRRYLGVASFAYATLHLLVFFKDNNAAAILRSFVRPTIVPGWIAFVLMAAMAATSFDAAVRGMGRNWKRLQQIVYPAAILTFLHWVLTDKNYLNIAIYTGPLILLTIWRLTRTRTPLDPDI